MKFKSLALCAPIALLAACGGGGSSSAPPATGGGGTPTPSPAPAPAPAPAPTYTAFDDLTGDQAFASTCSVFVGPSSMPSAGSGATFRTQFASHTFTAATETWSFDPLVFIGEPAPFGPSSLVSDPPAGLIAYERANMSGANDTFTITQAEFQGIQFGFVRAFDLFFNEGSVSPERYLCAFGVPTVDEDTFPLAGEDYPEIAFIGTARRIDRTSGAVLQEFDLSPSVVSFSADLDATDVVTITVAPRGQEILADGSLSATVTEFAAFETRSAELRTGPDGTTGLDDPNAEAAQFEGRLTAPTATDSISLLSGWFFGPRAEEAGFTFFVEYTDDSAGGNDRLVFNGLGLAKQ